MNLSKEKYAWLGQIPIGIGAVLNGWNIPEEDMRDPNRLAVVDFRAMTPECRLNCFHCFTDKNKKTLPLEEVKRIISEIAEMGARAIDFVGEGEPTLDKNFFEIIEFTSSLNVVPVVFTDGATKMRDINFVKRLKDSGASVCLKGDSLFNADYQNWVVQDKSGRYFDERNEALTVLAEEGFNEVRKDGTTRMGLNMVISSKNIQEAPDFLMYCRRNNFWPMFASYLPSGRSGRSEFDESLRPHPDWVARVRKLIGEIDEEEFGFKHEIFNNFITIGCVERMQIYGDGRVSPCPGNSEIIGNVSENSIKFFNQKILNCFPQHNPKCFDGYCIYRSR